MFSNLNNHAEYCIEHWLVARAWAERHERQKRRSTLKPFLEPPLSALFPLRATSRSGRSAHASSFSITSAHHSVPAHPIFDSLRARATYFLRLDILHCNHVVSSRVGRYCKFLPRYVPWRNTAVLDIGHLAHSSPPLGARGWRKGRGKEGNGSID